MIPPYGSQSQSDQVSGPYNKSTPTPNEQQNLNGILKPSRNRGPGPNQANPADQFNRNDGHRRNNYKEDDYYEEEGESYGDEEEYYSDEYSRSYD